ncbi:MAG: outer membrane protein assembly factor BamA [Alphaproteobacteria bacterium]|nr:outer membrane protein assembly factor BamA [Alphaproteobacteria bacterium]
MSLNGSGGGAGRAIFTFVVFIAGLASSFTAQAQAQAPAPASSLAPQTGAPQTGAAQPTPIIQGVLVRGNQRIEAGTVTSYLPLQPGMPADPELLDLSLKTLFNTGLFSDVSLEMQENGALMIDVKENPIVNRVIFDGNKKIKEDKITEEIQLAPRIIYTRSKVQADAQRIVELYRAKGRFAASVTPKVTPLAQNRIDVIFEIDEGPKTGVAKVNFVGNKVFTDIELGGVILTKESRWWRFFTSNDNYDPDRLEFERELLRKHYGRNGYADFSVLSAVAELTPDRKDFFITFTVDEGPKYTVGEVRVKTTLAKLDEDVLERFIPIRTGTTFDSEKIESSVESITFATGSTGYAFVDVNPRLSRHAETNTMDITFEVNEGPRVYVERINIKGNTRTLDKIIRREVRIAEGDPFNRVLVDRSKSRVRSLGFFKEVEIEEKPGSAPDRTELDITVQEQATGSFSIGIGVSSTDNFIVDLSVEERNLMGRGQLLRFRAQASSRTRQVNIQFTQPYFLGRNLAAGVSAFNQRTNFRESGFIRNRIGFGLNTGFQISEYGRGGLNYQFTNDDVTIDRRLSTTVPVGGDPLSVLIPGATPISVAVDGQGAQVVTATLCDFVIRSLDPTCQSRGQFVTSLIGASISFDTRNDPFRPTRGWRAVLSTRFAGVGGDVNYYQTEVSGAYYHRLIGKFVGVLKGRAGYIDGYGGDDVRLSDRFFEGASSFRGFEVAGVGPRFVTRFDSRRNRPDGQSIGAKAYAIGTVEILLPLPLPKEYGIRAALFSDFGTVGLVDESTKFINGDTSLFLDVPLLDADGVQVLDDMGNAIILTTLAPVQDALALRVSAGVSVSWDSPFGPVRFDFAKVLRKEIYDQTEGFRFSAGTSF